MATSTKRQSTYFNPLSPSDNPDQILDKLKTFSEFTSNVDTESLNKESTKQMIALFDNLTQKFVPEAIKEHPQLKLILACCFVDMVKILEPGNSQLQSKASLIINSIIDALKSSDKLKEPHYFVQFYYLLQHFSRNQAYRLFADDKSWDLAEDFIQVCFEVVDSFERTPEVFLVVQQILKEFLESANDPMKEDVLEELVLPFLLVFDRDDKKSRKRELVISLIKDKTWDLQREVKHKFSKLCVDIFRKRGIYKNISPPINPDKLCYIIQTLSKIDYEVIRSIWVYLENEINLTSRKELKKLYLTLIGKICASKNSQVSTNCTQVFNFFVETLTSTKNKPFRQDLLELAFKYIRNFTYCKDVSISETNRSTIKYDVYKRNLENLECKIKELMRKGEEDIKVFILEKIRTLSLENEQYISQELLKETSVLLLFPKEKHKSIIIDLLSDVYVKYCSALYEEGIYDFEDLQGNHQLVNGEVSTTYTLRRKNIAKKYLWISERLISFFVQNPTNSFYMLHKAIIKIIGLNTCQPKMIAKRLCGFYYNVWNRKYQEKSEEAKTLEKSPSGMKLKKKSEENADFKSINYSDFIKKKLKYKWFNDEEILNIDFHHLIIGMNKLLKLCYRLHANFTGYLEGIAKHDQQKKEGGKNYIMYYYLFNRSIDDVEKDLTLIVEQASFGENMKTINNKEESLEAQQQALVGLIDDINKDDCKLLFSNMMLNIFHHEISESLAEVISSILQKDAGYSIFLKEGLLNLSTYLVERHFSKVFTKQQGEIASFLTDNIETLVSNSKSMDLEGQKSKEKQAQNAYLTLCLKLLSLLNLQELSNREYYINLEGFKYVLTDLLTKLELVGKQAKYGARLVKNLDEVTSEEISVKVIGKMISHLDVKSSTLQATLRTLSELFKSNKDTFIDHIEPLYDFLIAVVSEPVTLPREELISELSQCKKIALKMHFVNYYSVNHQIINESFKKRTKDFKDLLLQLLLNFYDVCAGHTISDKDYIRIYALDYFLEIIATEDTTELDAEAFAKLSLLCYDDNDDIKRYLITAIMYKRGGRHSTLNYYYFTYFFFFTFANDPSLKQQAEESLRKEMANISESYQMFIERTKTENITRSPEYTIVYIIFLMCNNPKIALKVKVLPYHFYRCLDSISEMFTKLKSSHREEYILEILNTLKNYNPVVYEELQTTRMEFTDIKKRKVVKKITKKEEKKESQEQDFLTFQQIIDDIISYLTENYSFKKTTSRELDVQIPRNLYQYAGQRGTSARSQREERVNSHRASAQPKQTEVQMVKEQSPPQNDQSPHVRKLDFTSGDFELKSEDSLARSRKRKKVVQIKDSHQSQMIIKLLLKKRKSS